MHSPSFPYAPPSTLNLDDLAMAQANLVDTLRSTLLPDATARVGAELRLAQLCGTSQTGVELARIATSSEVELFALKKYVKEHWSPFFPTFKGGPATAVEDKAVIRQLIFASLSDPVRKIRLASAALISSIAHPDWPDDWPSLMNELLVLIEGSKDAVDGGMRVLNEFVGVDLTEDQLLPVARSLLPRLLGILGSPQTHGPSTRARSILIFRQCVMTLFTVKDEHPASVKAAVHEIFPQWLDAFRQILEVDAASELGGEDWEILAIRVAIFNTLEIVLNSFPSILKPLLPTFLTLSITHLTALSPIYAAYFLSSSSDLTVPPNTEEDSDVPSDLPGLVATVLDFVTQVARRKAIRGMFVLDDGRAGETLDAAVGCAMRYARMTTDDEDTWATDPNAFVADEDDEMVSYNVRSASIDFTTALIDSFETTTLSTLWTSFQRIAAESDAAHAQGDDDWWKGYEGALTIVGAVSTDLLEHVNERAEEGGESVFDLGQLFSSVVPTYLGASQLPFLQGRSFVFASQFAQALPAALANQYIDAAIQVLDTESAGVPVKVSAVRALNNFLRHLKSSIEPARAAQTLARLLPLLPQTTENTLVLIVETLEAALKVAGPSLETTDCSAVIGTVLNTWFEKPDDPMLGCAMCELFASFASIPTPIVLSNLISESLPALSSILLEILIDPFSTRASAALDLIDNVFDGRGVELGEGLFGVVAEGLFGALGGTEDREVLQTGLHIVTTVVRKDVDQLLNWTSSSGQTGLSLVLTLVARLLDPSASESGGIFVGDLVIHLLRKAGGAIGDVLPGLLEAFVVRLASAETASFSQSLVLPFAYLLHSQTETVLTLLEGIVVPATGSSPARPALEVLLSKWSENVDVFQGYWNLKVSTVALQQLFLSQRPSLQHVVVKGELLLTAANTNSIMTRARAKANPDQYSQIPFAAKALKILLHDISSSAPTDAMGYEGVEGAESDDGDDEWADDGAEYLSGDKDLDYLSDMMGAGGSLAKYLGEDDSEDGGDQEGDEDLKDDPIYNLDLHAHLLSFFRQAYEGNTNDFRSIAERYLTPSEKDSLAQILQSAP